MSASYVGVGSSKELGEMMPDMGTKQLCYAEEKGEGRGIKGTSAANRKTPEKLVLFGFFLLCWVFGFFGLLG